MSERGSYQELWLEDHGFTEYVGRIASLEEAISLHTSYCESGNWPLEAEAVIRTYSEATGILVEERPLFSEDDFKDE